MGFFSIFKKEKKYLQDFSELAVDMHSHLIPGIDDGAASVGDSVNLAWQLEQMGFKKIITTPHIMADGYKNSPENILPGLEEVRKALTEKNLNILIEAAAEYFLDDGFNEKLESGKILPLKEKYLLFELSYLNRPNNLEPQVFKMKSEGYFPLLAHPERYPYYYDEKLEMYREIKNLGVFFQINIPSLTGAYGPGPQDFGRRLIDADLVDFLGTDLHNQHQLKYMDMALKDKWIFKAVQSGTLKNNLLL